MICQRERQAKRDSSRYTREFDNDQSLLVNEGVTVSLSTRFSRLLEDDVATVAAAAAEDDDNEGDDRTSPSCITYLS